VYFKGVIDDVVEKLMTDGHQVGSADGTGDGLLSATVDGALNSGVFVFNDITQMVLKNVVTLSGDIEFKVEEDAILVIGESEQDESVTVKPAAGAEYAQLVFNVDAGRVLEVHVLNDLYFKAAAALQLYVSFRGKGTTIFRMPSGRTISFGPASNASPVYGVSVQILMELSEQDVAQGVQQVIFEPWSYVADAVNTRLDTTTKIMLGRSSSIRFFSDNEFGIDGIETGYGTVAFDACHSGTGRMVLDLAAGVVSGDRYDAGVNIWGSLITGTGFDDEVINEDLRTSLSPLLLNLVVLIASHP
jgi:hypothetical protein